MIITGLMAAFAKIKNLVLAVSAYFKRADTSQHNSVTLKKAEDISVGNQNASTGGIATGAGSTINIYSQPDSKAVEKSLRFKEVEILFIDYKNTHDNIPPTRSAQLQSAEPYINRILASQGVSWRFNAIARTVAYSKETGHSIHRKSIT